MTRFSEALYDWAMWTRRAGPRSWPARSRMSEVARRIVWSKMRMREAPRLWERGVSIRWSRWVQEELSRVFQELFYFWVVLGLDLLVVDEVLLLALVVHVLETMAVNRVFTLFAGDVVDDDTLGDVRAEINVVGLADALVSDSRFLFMF